MPLDRAIKVRAITETVEIVKVAPGDNRALEVRIEEVYKALIKLWTEAGDDRQ